MQKIACIYSFRESAWVSCQKIVSNLRQAYGTLQDFEIKDFHYGSDASSIDIQDLGISIHEYLPDIVVIIDHKPHPLNLLAYYLKLLTHYKNPKPQILFHLFGDFTIYYPDWDKLGTLLSGYEVKFVVASKRQKILIDRYLVPPQECHVCPFPIQKEAFFYEPSLREKQRKAWGISDDEHAFVFTGRLSRQKRIHVLIELFAECIEKIQTQRPHLYLYGSPDHIGDQFLGKWESEGEYFRKINKLYHQLPADIQPYIHFMGHLQNSELQSVYLGADYLLNLSVHNDEDFGMSVAEAQCSGLPAILTDWGGLAGFEMKEVPGATTFIPVRIGEKSKILSQNAVREVLSKIVSEKRTLDRKKISTLALNKLSIEAAGKILKKIYTSPWQGFEGFSPFFKQVFYSVSFSSLPYMTRDNKINDIYKKIYSAYVRNN